MIDADFHFLRPWWLLVTPGLLWIVRQLRRQANKTMSWKAACDAHLLPHLLIGKKQLPSTAPWIFLGVGWVLATLALAGPTWSKHSQPLMRAQSGLVLLLDLSQSMDVQDIHPSRLTRAKHKVLDILKRRHEGQTALIVFSQEPFIVAPLTNDAATIAAMVPTLSTDLLPVQGSRVDLALEQADHLLSQGGLSEGDILLITDGAEGRTVREKAADLRKAGRRLSVIGVGTSEGAPIPLTHGGFLKDRSGAIVIPQFEDSSLRSLAKAGGGKFVRLQHDDSDLDYVQAFDLDRSRIQESEGSTRTTDIWNEEGPWLVLALLVVALPAFRRGWVAFVVLGMVLLPHTAKAWTWDDLWLRADQQGIRQLNAGQPKEAATLFSDPQWKGIANYHAGDFQRAVEAFAQQQTPDGYFNRGNALARSGNLEEALVAYETVLNTDPTHEDAAFNAALIRDLMKQQQRQSQRGQQGQNGKDAERQEPSVANNGTTGAKASSLEKPSAMEHQSSEEGLSSQKREDHQKQDGQDKLNQAAAEELSDPSSADALQRSATLSQHEPKESGDFEEQSKHSSHERQPQTTDTPKKPNPSQEEYKNQQALAQWLRRIPDDPGGLLRRKFLLEHQRRKGNRPHVEQPW